VLDAEFIPVLTKWTPVIFSFTGAGLAMVLYSVPNNGAFSLVYSTLGKNIYTFLNNKWHFDYVFNHYIAKPSLILATMFHIRLLIEV
jgi:NADH-ubiquinone oxidoreductase chain 5